MSARGLVSLLVMILTSVGGRARRGPSRRSAAKACGVAHPVTLVVGVRGETPDRNAVEDGKAVALPRRPEHRPKAGTGRDRGGGGKGCGAAARAGASTKSG